MCHVTRDVTSTVVRVNELWHMRMNGRAQIPSRTSRVPSDGGCNALQKLSRSGAGIAARCVAFTSDKLAGQRAAYGAVHIQLAAFTVPFVVAAVATPSKDDSVTGLSGIARFTLLQLSTT